MSRQCQRRLSQPPPSPEPCHAKQGEPDYRRHPERYEFPRFVIPTADGPVEFRLAVPKEKYDAFAILDLFIKHHGNPSDTSNHCYECETPPC